MFIIFRFAFNTNKTFSIHPHPPLPLQTGFVENLKPQFNPGQPLSASTRATPSTPVATPLVDNAQFDEMKAEIQDLKEKLDTIKSNNE